jgi:chorismate mutase
VSGDLDMLQIVTERTHLMTTRMGVQSTVIYDPDRIRDQLDEVQRAREKGLLTDAEATELEDELVERLLIARTRPRREG